MLRREHKREEERYVFWPDYAFHAAIVVLSVFLVLALMALFLPPPHESVARPADNSYIPRPEWYFLFLMQMLQFFPGELEVVGAVIVPGLAVLVLLLLPFYDRRPTRRPLKRPLATTVAVLVFIGIVSLTIKGMVTTPPSMTSRSAFMELGERLYQEQGCANCHTINGVGSPIGPELAGMEERRTLSWIHQYLEDPLVMKPDSAMPGYLGTITHEEIESVSVYLLSLEKDLVPLEVIPASEEPSPSPSPAETQPPKEVSPAPPGPTGPPQVTHSVEGRADCLVCHRTGIGGATEIPANHSGRSNDTCLACHKSG